MFSSFLADHRRVLILPLLVFLEAGTLFAQGPAFTYQGRLTDGGTPANGSYDLQFTLWDVLSGGTQQPQPSPVVVTRLAVGVANGIFTVQLDFGASAFPGADRFLEIGVKPTGSSNPFTILTPRQQITSTPYATRSASSAAADTAVNATNATNATNAVNATNATNATTATNATQLGGVAASQYVVTSDSRLTDSRPPTPGSSNYIQNTTSQQAGNFNISGNGSAGTLSASGVGVTNFANEVGISLNNQNTDADVWTLDSTGGSSSLGAHNFTISNLFQGRRQPKFTINSSGNVGIGTTNPNGLQVSSAVSETARNVDNVRFGVNLGTPRAIFEDAASATQWEIDNSAGRLRIFNPGAERFTIDSSGNVGIGTNSPGVQLHVARNTTYNNGSTYAIAASNSDDPRLRLSLGYDRTIDAGVIQASREGDTFNKTLQLNPNGGGVAIGGNSGSVLIVRGIDTSTIAFEVTNSNNTFTFGAFNDGTVAIGALGTGGGTQMCRSSNSQVSTCGSSLRYKKDLVPFVRGLDLLKRLRPISFTWKDRPERDLGLAAEDVEKVEPLLTFRNAKAEIEGVKYDKLTVVLINSIKEQQAQIEAQHRLLDDQRGLMTQQQEQITRQEKTMTRQSSQLKQQQSESKSQQTEIDGLKKLVCRKRLKVGICRQ